METNNFDNQIKNQLEQRTIEPSAKSWEQLRSKLDKKEKKPVSLFWWMSIAASFVAGVLIVSQVYHTSDVSGSPMLVDEPPTSQEVNKIEPIPNKIKATTETGFSEETATQIAHSEVKNHTVTKSSSPQETNGSAFQKEEQKDAHLYNKGDFHQKADDTIVVAVIDNSVNYAIEDEVDYLLHQATEQLYREKKYMENASSITANSLLHSVETELNQTFRENILEILKEGFLKTKNAVANRYNQ